MLSIVVFHIIHVQSLSKVLNQFKGNSDKLHIDMRGPTISPENIEKRKEVFSKEGANNKGKMTLHNFHCILMYVRASRHCNKSP